VIISIEALLLANYWVSSRTVMQMQSNAIGYAKFDSRSHNAMIRVYDEAGNVIQTHQQQEILKSRERYTRKQKAATQ
jgi:hypothetical protein